MHCISVNVYYNTKLLLVHSYPVLKPATYLDVITATALQNPHVRMLPNNVHIETITDAQITRLKVEDSVLRQHLSINVQIALSKRMAITVCGTTTVKVLAQVSSILAASLSKTDNLQHLIAGTDGSNCIFFLQFKAPKLLKTIQMYMSNFYKTISIAKASTLDAANILKLADCVSLNLSDDEREHMHATLNGTLPLSVKDDSVVELPNLLRFLITASRALTAFECGVCNAVHNTPCFTCFAKPVCKLHYSGLNQSEFAAWSNSNDAFICNGCGHTICKSCLKLHKCEVGTLLPHVHILHTFAATSICTKLADDPVTFLKDHLPSIGFDTVELKEVKIAIRAMVSFECFERECRHVLRHPGEWAVGLDSYDDSQVFLAAYGVDKRYVKLRDIAKSRIGAGVQEYADIVLRGIKDRKQITTNKFK